jgi:hypothetical protein
MAIYTSTDEEDIVEHVDEKCSGQKRAGRQKGMKIGHLCFRTMKWRRGIMVTLL